MLFFMQFICMYIMIYYYKSTYYRQLKKENIKKEYILIMYIKDVIFTIKKDKNTKKEMKIVVIYKNFRIY